MTAKWPPLNNSVTSYIEKWQVFSFPLSGIGKEGIMCEWLLITECIEVRRCASHGPMSPFNCEVGCGHMLCHMFQNSSCCESSVIFHGIFNPGHVVKDASIDANISSQNAAICIRQYSIKYPIADSWGSRDFLREKKTGYHSSTR